MIRISCIPRPLLAVVSSLLVTGCQSVTPVPSGITIRSQVEAPLLVFPLAAETAARTDPAMELRADQHLDRRLPARGELILEDAEVEGAFGAAEDLVLFIYEISGETARFAAAKYIPRKELENSARRVIIRGVDLHRHQ